MTILALTLLGGCAGQDDSPSDLSTFKQELSGTPGTFTGCTTSDQTAHLSQALSRARQALSHPNMLPMLIEEQFEGGEHNNFESGPEWGTGYPEWIQKRMLENINTPIFCAPTQSSASRNNEESIGIHASLAQNATTPVLIDELAGTIAHEVAHTKGFKHSGGYTLYSVPTALDAIVQVVLGRGSRFKTRTADTSMEVTLAPVGNEDLIGSDEQSCFGTKLAAGFFAYGNAGSRPAGIGLRCKPNRGGAIDSSSGLAGNSIGPFQTSSCPAGQVMVGAFGWASADLQSIGALCASEESVWAGDPVTGTPQNLMGAQIDLQWRRQCPRAMAVKAMHARSNNGAISRVELTCQSSFFAEHIAYSTWNGPAAGTTGTSWINERCPGREVLNGINSRYHDGLTRLEGKCVAISGSGPTAFINDFGHRVAGHGNDGSDGEYVPDTCPTGYLLVGMSLGADSTGIKGTQPICADMRKWGNLAYSENNTLYTLAARGSQTVPWSAYRCPRGYYLNGWWISELNGVKGLQGLCRPFTLN
jgi:hypothetical protein